MGLIKFTGEHFMVTNKDHIYYGRIGHIVEINDEDGEKYKLWLNGSPTVSLKEEDYEPYHPTKREIARVNYLYSIFENMKNHAWHKRDYYGAGEFAKEFVYNWLFECKGMSGVEIVGHSNRLFIDNRHYKPKGWTRICEICSSIGFQLGQEDNTMTYETHMKRLGLSMVHRF